MTSPPGRLRIAFHANRTERETFLSGSIVRAKFDRELTQVARACSREEQSPTYDRSLVGEIMGVASAYPLTELICSRRREIGVEPSEHNLELANVKSFARGRALAASDLMQTYRKINTVGRAFAGFFDRFDVWLTPTMSDVAPVCTEN